MISASPGDQKYFLYENLGKPKGVAGSVGFFKISLFYCIRGLGTSYKRAETKFKNLQ